MSIFRTLFRKTSRVSTALPAVSEAKRQYFYALKQRIAKRFRQEFGVPLAHRDENPQAQSFFDAVIEAGNREYYGILLDSEPTADPDLKAKLAIRHRELLGLPPNATEERFQAAWNEMKNKVRRGEEIY